MCNDTRESPSKKIQKIQKNSEIRHISQNRKPPTLLKSSVTLHIQSEPLGSQISAK